MKHIRIFIASVIITVLILGLSLPYQAIAQEGGPEFIPGRYIVVLDDGVSPQDVTRGHGVVPDFVYSHALNGFSGPISPVALAELEQDPRVLHIEQDQMMHTTLQTLPTGIDRIDAESIYSTPDPYAGLVTVAILDTGIDYTHPDLNVVHRVDCATRGPTNTHCFENKGDDGYGHGSHVAGTVAALDNEIGPVGIVPGADLWSIRVLDNNGSGYYSWVIAGIDYVTANKASIDVANMSLGGSKSDAVNWAVGNSIAAGVVYAVSAGNSMSDAKDYSPASTPSAITVSAIADFDGKGGGLDNKIISFSSCTEDTDDSFACFSNYGSLVDIAAPGVSIFSTYKDGGYATFSGTSMASPHVAGAAAKIIADSRSSNPLLVLTPSDVLSALITNSIKSTDPTNYFTEDPDAFAEPLLYVGNQSPSIAPPSLVAHYQFEDNLLDSAGEFDGTLEGGTATYVTGVDGNAFSFDGLTGINITNTSLESTLEFEGDDSWSASSWFKTSVTSGAPMIVSDMQEGGTYRGWDLYVNGGNGAIGFQIINDVSSDQWINALTTENGYADGEWHHAVATYDGSRNVSGIQIYVDDTPLTVTADATTDEFTGTILNNIDVMIGTRDHLNYNFDGQIDDLRIYDYELTNVEVTDLFNLFAPDTTGPTPIIATSETNPTNSDPVPFTIDFGETIDPGTFDGGDITASSGSIQGLATGDNQNWTFEVASPDDPSTLSVSISAGVLDDVSGNTNFVSNIVNIDIDQTASTPPSIDAPSSPTTNNAPTITGTGIDGETIKLLSNLDGEIGTTTVLGDNTWSVTTSSLQVGSHLLTATQTDPAGNTSDPSPATAITIEPILETSMHVHSITSDFQPKGNSGKGSLSFIINIAEIVDSSHDGVNGANVSVSLFVGTNPTPSDTAGGLTNSNGNVTFTINNASIGTDYKLVVTGVEKTGYAWNGINDGGIEIIVTP